MQYARHLELLKFKKLIESKLNEVLSTDPTFDEFIKSKPGSNTSSESYYTNTWKDVINYIIDNVNNNIYTGKFAFKELNSIIEWNVDQNTGYVSIVDTKTQFKSEEMVDTSKFGSHVYEIYRAVRGYRTNEDRIYKVFSNFTDQYMFNAFLKFFNSLKLSHFHYQQKLVYEEPEFIDTYIIKKAQLNDRDNRKRSDYDLNDWISTELKDSELSKLNSILSKNGITYQFTKNTGGTW